ncbi:MAG: MBL fold metallo-hydrolase [Gemmatimonadota bacterium]
MMRTLSRRDFARTLGTAAVAAPLLPESLADLLPRFHGSFFKWKKVSNRVRVAFRGGGNAMLVSKGKRAVLVDCKNFGFGGILRHEAEEIGGRLTHVINTHHHSDHTGGNLAFAGEVEHIGQAKLSARVVALTERLRDRVAGSPEQWVAQVRESWRQQSGSEPDAEFVERLEAFARRVASLEPARSAPSTGFDREAEVRAPAGRFELRHVSNGHTDNDAFIHLPEENLVHAGDLLFHELHPYIDVGAGATTEGWQRCLEALIDLCDERTVVVPGHGEITDRRGLRRQSEYFDRLRELVGEAMGEGRSREEITELRPAWTERYGHEELRSHALGVVYDELSAS